MDIKLSTQNIENSTDDTIVIFCFEGLNQLDSCVEDKQAKELINNIIKNGDFTGKDQQLSLIHTHNKIKPKKIILAGLGLYEKFHLNKIRTTVSQIINYVRQNSVKEISFPCKKLKDIDEKYIVSAISESIILTINKYDFHKTDRIVPKLESVNLIVSKQSKELENALSSSLITADSVVKARNLINTSPSIATPEFIANIADNIAKENKLSIEIYNKQAIIKNKMNGILAVSSGSIHEPKVVVLKYNKKQAKKTIVLVGKGITFDSGGLSLKNSVGMETMKTDMTGAAVVIYTINAIAKLNLDVNVIGIAMLTENMPGHNAYKPGDIISTMSGKTIEVLNTDAEGRIVLADGLHLAKRYSPDYVIDIATLTGAAMVALGSECAAILGNDQKLINSLIESGKITYERLWQLPMFDEYADYIKSDFADMKNVVSNPSSFGGAITASKFLQNFIDDKKWAHLDIAPVDWNETDKDYRGRGGTAFGIRLLTHFLSNIS